MGPVRQIVAAHAGLVTKLRPFSNPFAVRLAAALSLFPEFHAQTIRLEILQHLVAVSCTGRQTPQRDDLAEWAGKYMAESPFARHEDPVEDVFVGCVNSPFGSFRLLMGVFADADFWVERLLVFLAGKQKFPPFQTAVTRVIPLLKMSEALVARVGLQRYTEGGGSRAMRIQVPRWRELQTRVAAVVFSDVELLQLGITRGELSEFLLTDEQRANLINESVWNSTLERRPLIEQPEGITIAMPSTLGRSALRFLVELIARSMGGWADMLYQTENASLFVNEVASRLGIAPISFNEPARPDGIPPLYPFFGQFDVGKPAILLTYCPSLIDAAADFAGHDHFSEEQETALESYLRACAAEFEKNDGFSGGLVLISLAGGLRTHHFGLQKWSSHWRIHACTLPDWLCITSGNKCSAMRLWKLGDHEALLKSNGTEMLNLAGLPNLFAAWKRNGFRILPRTRDPCGLTMLTLDCVFAVDLRVETRRKEDPHCVRSHDGKRWVRVTRQNAEMLFTEDANLRLYVDREAVKERCLRGCVEEGCGVWWIILQAPETTPELRRVAFQLWQCVFSWVARVARVAMSEWPSLQSKGSIEITLDLPNLANWRTSHPSKDAVPQAALSLSADAGQASIVLTLLEGFLHEFHTPQNTAEQKIVDCLLVGAAKLAEAELDETRLAKLRHEVVRNDHARYFHFVRALRTEQFFAGSAQPDPLFVADEDFAFSQLGLTQLLGHSGAGDIVGLAACQDFLKDAVAKVWERIESKLSPFDRNSLVSSCLHGLDEIARDEVRWDMTARSQFALHADTTNVHRVWHERRSEREQASLCNRLIIETAQYACSAGSRIFTRADHLTLLADMALLVMLAHHRDGIACGFIEPRVKLLPNGEIEVDETFYAGTFGRYMSKRSQGHSEDAAESYDEYFAPGLAAESFDSEQLNPAASKLDKVFVPEFGFSVNLLFKLMDAFRDFAVQAGQARGPLSETDMLAFLKHSGFSPTQSDEFLNRFTLPIRSAWNADLPSSCRQQDVFPWRFRRQLSLLTRPIVQVHVDPRAWYVSVPALEKSMAYLLGNVEGASFPKEFFRSKEMQRYIGDTVNKCGHEFTRRVGLLVAGVGYHTHVEVEVTKLGASKNDGLGDIDVLAWDVPSGHVLAIECKRLLPALTVREVIQRLEDFRGNRQEKDSLGRHLRRMDWLLQHLEALAHYTTIPVSRIHLTPLLVTSETVPMQFFQEMNFSVSHVVPYDELPNFLAAKLRLGGEQPSERSKQ